jgi:hypothetical protein
MSLAILSKIGASDPIGRVTSRCKALMQNYGEIVVEGPDYREIQSQEAAERRKQSHIIKLPGF